MTRFASFVLLLGLVLPYARMPGCVSAGHEHAGQERSEEPHAGHGHAGVERAAPHDSRGNVSTTGPGSDGARDTDDCHRGMACGTTLQGVLRADAGRSIATQRIPAVRVLAPVPHDAPAREPLSPPPQSD